MPLVIFEGPEAAGKSTLIETLEKRWGPNRQFRGWGPRESWLEYCQPLFDDLKACKEDPNLLVVWSRSWLSRAVYNTLLNQGYIVPREVTKELDNIIIREKGLLLLVVSPINVLLRRRLERLNQEGSKPDHPLNPDKELSEFYVQNRSRKWKVVSGVDDPEKTVSFILNMLVQQNPECRMDSRMEEPIAV